MLAKNFTSTRFRAEMSGQEKGGSPKEPFDPYRRSAVSGSASYAGAGLQFAIALLVFLFLGQWLDERLGTAPWLMMLGVFVGGGGGFWAMYRKLMAEQAREERERAAKRQAEREPGSS